VPHGHQKIRLLVIRCLDVNRISTDTSTGPVNPSRNIRRGVVDDSTLRKGKTVRPKDAPLSWEAVL
jgi:hypothetical protein